MSKKISYLREDIYLNWFEEVIESRHRAKNLLQTRMRVFVCPTVEQRVPAHVAKSHLECVYGVLRTIANQLDCICPANQRVLATIDGAAIVDGWNRPLHDMVRRLENDR